MKPSDRIAQYKVYRGYTATRQLPVPRPPRRKPRRALIAIAVMIVVGTVAFGLQRNNHAEADKSPANGAQLAEAVPVNNCAANRLEQQILIDISRRHLWACTGTKEVYDAPVITGREQVAENKTPRGNFQIYAKATDQTLTGTDSTGDWDVRVHYWMPFLDNEHGTYGLHDATWRPNKDFGRVSPDSNDASHGCIQMPLNAIKWLYQWSPISTTVTIQS